MVWILDLLINELDIEVIRLKLYIIYVLFGLYGIKNEFECF